MRTRLTVLFEDPFCAGVFERKDEGRLETAKIIFGAEPKDCELYRLIIDGYSRLKFSRSLLVEKTNVAKRINPKRLQRLARREATAREISTKAQEALRLEYERNKKERQELSKERKEELKRIKYENRQLKKKKNSSLYN